MAEMKYDVDALLLPALWFIYLPAAADGAPGLRIRCEGVRRVPHACHWFEMASSVFVCAGILPIIAR